jgi:hypothetical protein
MKDLDAEYYDVVYACNLKEAQEQMKQCLKDNRVPLFQLSKAQGTTNMAYRIFLREGVLNWQKDNPDTELADDLLEFICDVLESTEGINL